MALKNCFECNAQVSDAAKICPQCGISKPVKRKSSVSKVIVALLGLTIIGTFFAMILGTKTTRSPASAPSISADVVAKEAAEKEKKAEVSRMAAAGGLILKRAMKDPTAFVLTSVVVRDGGAVCYQYRAKNSFGAIFPSAAVMTSKGRMLAQEQDGNKFVSYWNKECRPAGGNDITDYAVTMLSIMER